MRLLFYAFLITIAGNFHNNAFAQYVKITGSITDAVTKEPLLGVTIQLENTSTGAITDLDGTFKLEAFRQELDNTLFVVHYLGYKTLTFSYEEGKNFYQIALQPDFIQGEELIVSGQGVNMERRRLSTSVSSVNSEDLELLSSDRIDGLLQSSIPSAQFQMTKGQPGTSSIIRGRGVVSALVNSTPIIYVDGIRVDNLNTTSALGGGSSAGAATSSISDIPTENIERIEYVSGGAATTLYGSDAANGVIQILPKSMEMAHLRSHSILKSGQPLLPKISYTSTAPLICYIKMGYIRNMVSNLMVAIRILGTALPQHTLMMKGSVSKTKTKTKS